MNYTEIDQRLHQLSQLIANVNRTFVPSEEDDSHTNLQLDAIGQRIVGRWINTPIGRVICSINLSNQKVEWLNDAQEVLDSSDTIGKTMSEIETDQQAVLQSLKLDPKGYNKKLHFAITAYEFANDPVIELSQTDVNEWLRYRKLANEWCCQVLFYTKSTSEIRIWPHHFDTGIYTRPNENIGLGFGLAMEDRMVKSPYFYLAGYPTQGELNYDSIPELPVGKWELGEFWKGAVLPVSGLEGLSREEQDHRFEQFIRPSIDWFLRF
jgi:hypothetical protein